MARIRTIKPEFPQSESMGRVSRDARLLFVMLWTICDDHGRTRAHSRMLASLLFPYDDDAGEGIKDWLQELENEGCVRIYEAEGSQYLQVTKWSAHQRIDKPSKPQFPDPSEGTLEPSRESIEDSQTFHVGREGKGRDQGREGKGEEQQPSGSMVEPGPKRADPLPYQAIVDAYNRTLAGLPKVRELTPKRRTAIRTAWAASADRRSTEFWEAYFAECQDDAFLNGTGPYRNGHENWRPDFDYLLKPDVVTRTFERAMDRLDRTERAS